MTLNLRNCGVHTRAKIEGGL